MAQTKSKQERQAWWRGLTLEEQADYVEKVMRRQGKTPNRELVVKNLVEQGQYKGAEGLVATKREIRMKVNLMQSLAEGIRSTLDNMGTLEVDALSLYEFDPSLQESMRYKFYQAKRAMDELERYFNDEDWAQWEVFRDSERRKND